MAYFYFYYKLIFLSELLVYKVTLQMWLYFLICFEFITKNCKIPCNFVKNKKESKKEEKMSQLYYINWKS